MESIKRLNTFSNLINERFVNAVGYDSSALDIKHKYKNQVWDILQKSYAPIGGIKGNGFASADEMVHKIPFWKIIRQNEKVHAVVMYKDKSGRKSVAVGSDGSDYAKKHLHSVVVNDIKRAYGEKSKASLGLVMKTIPWEVLKPYVKTPEEVSKVIGGVEVIPIKKVKEAEWPKDAKLTLTKYPQLIDYGYLTYIGDNILIFKVMIGSPGKFIK